MYKFIYILIFTSCFLSIQAQEGSIIDSTQGSSVKWNELDYREFTIKHPSDWTIDTSGTMGLNLIILSPLEIPEDQFRENLNFVLQQDLDSSMTLEQFVELSETQILQMITAAEIISSQKNSTTTPPHHDIVFKGTQGIYDLKFVQRYILIDSKAYVLTFTAQQSNFNNYEQYILSMLDSFTFPGL